MFPLFYISPLCLTEIRIRTHRTLREEEEGAIVDEEGAALSEIAIVTALTLIATESSKLQITTPTSRAKCPELWVTVEDYQGSLYCVKKQKLEHMSSFQVETTCVSKPPSMARVLRIALANMTWSPTRKPKQQ